MLVLSRNVGEEIIIGKDVCVAVIKVNGNRVFLGIKAPKKFSIDRKEIWHRKKTERMAKNNT